KDGVFSSLKGDSPFKLSYPAGLSWTYSPTISSMGARSRIAWISLSGILPRAIPQRLPCYTKSSSLAEYLRPPNFVSAPHGCNNGAHGTSIRGFFIRKSSPTQKVFARYYRRRGSGFSRRILRH